MRGIRFIYILAATIYFLPHSFCGEDLNSSLPPNAAKLIKQFDDWEKQKRKELVSSTNLKKKQVIEVLESHQAKATKSGDLEKGIAIRNTIRSLEKEIANNQQTISRQSANKLIDCKWSYLIKYRDGSNFTGIRTFKSDGNHYFNSNPNSDGKWFLKGDTLTVHTHNNLAVATFKFRGINSTLQGIRRRIHQIPAEKITSSAPRKK